MTITQTVLMIAAQKKYPFRQKKADETPEAFFAALIEHVEDRDWAMAHELRVGRAQADWTDVDAADFKDRLFARYQKPSMHEPRPGVHTFTIAELKKDLPVTDAEVMRLADEALEVLSQTRREKPQIVIPQLIHLLTTDGTLHGLMVERDDRVATLRVLVQHMPVYGYFVLGDAFMHVVDFEHGHKATKKDVLVAHVGTRSGLRVMKNRPYHYEGEAAVFEEALPDMDKVGNRSVEIDPYATVFAGPMPTQAQ